MSNQKLKAFFHWHVPVITSVDVSLRAALTGTRAQFTRPHAPQHGQYNVCNTRQALLLFPTWNTFPWVSRVRQESRRAVTKHKDIPNTSFQLLENNLLFPK